MTDPPRLLRPAEVKEAAEWFFGVSVVHMPGQRATARVSHAKKCYWYCLRRLGCSFEEIARITGADRGAIIQRLKRDPPLNSEVLSVLARAEEMMLREQASEVVPSRP